MDVFRRKGTSAYILSLNILLVGFHFIDVLQRKNICVHLILKDSTFAITLSMLLLYYCNMNGIPNGVWARVWTWRRNTSIAKRQKLFDILQLDDDKRYK